MKNFWLEIKPRYVIFDPMFFVFVFCFCENEGSEKRFNLI